MQRIEVNPNNLKGLARYLELGYSPDAQKRKEAEEFLRQMESRPGYGILLLHLVSMDSVNRYVRQSGAINFKNFVKRRWHEEQQIVNEDRKKIKGGIIDLMIKSPDVIQRQLSEALTLVANTDFPANKWPELLPMLVEKLKVQNWQVVIGVLRTANSIFKRYSLEMKTDKVLIELQYVLKVFAAPLQAMFVKVSQEIEKNSTNPGLLKSAFTAIHLLVSMYVSLHCIDLPEFFEDNMKVWFQLFHKYLTYKPAGAASFLLEDEDDEDKPTIFHELLGEVCTAVNLYIEKYEEEFKPYLEHFVKDIWGLLMNCTTEPRYDPVVTNALRFLTSTSKSVHFALFGNENTLKNICTNIIVPHMKFRQNDEECFEDNPVEYIQRDFEGSDAETRRRATTALVKGLRKNFEAQVTGYFAGHINNMLAEYKKNPKSNWKAKDAAIYLLSALTVQRSSLSTGVTEINQKVPLPQFISAEILPELQNYPNNHVVIQADVLKFIAQFRNHVSEKVLPAVFQSVARMMVSDNYVVHSYAALTIDRLLTMTRKDGKGLKVGAEGMKLMPTLLKVIFKHLGTKQSHENPYLMKCLLRITRAVPTEHLSGLVAPILESLKSKLFAIAKNPSNPQFNHYLFESIATLIRSLCGHKASTVTSFESSLFGPFQQILEKNVEEFLPYVFQIMGQMMLYGDGLRPAYTKIFPGLLSSALWEVPGNVTALVSLLKGYLRKKAEFVMPHMKVVLGIFQKLVASKAKDHEGFYLLEAIIQYCPTAAVKPFITPVLSVLFARLHSSKTQKFVRLLIVWVSLLISRHSAAFALAAIEQVQPNSQLFGMFMDKVYLPNAPSVCGTIERKMVAVACTNLLTKCPPMLQSPYQKLWGPVLLCAMKMLELPEEDTEEDHREAAAAAGGQPFAASSDGPTAASSSSHHQPNNTITDALDETYSGPGFFRLASVARDDVDPLKDIADAKKYFAQCLTQLSQQRPGTFGSVIKGSLPGPAFTTFQSYFNQFHLTPKF